MTTNKIVIEIDDSDGNSKSPSGRRGASGESALKSISAAASKTASEIAKLGEETASAVAKMSATAGAAVNQAGSSIPSLKPWAGKPNATDGNERPSWMPIRSANAPTFTPPAKSATPSAVQMNRGVGTAFGNSSSRVASAASVTATSRIGGAAASVGAIAAGATGGPVGVAAMAALSAAGEAASAALRKVADVGMQVYRHLDALGERFKFVSAPVAAAKARQEVAFQQGEIQRGKFLGDDIAKFVNKQTELQTTVQTALAGVNKILLTAFQPLLEAIADGMKALVMFAVSNKDAMETYVNLMESMHVITAKHAEQLRKAIDNAAKFVIDNMKENKQIDKDLMLEFLNMDNVPVEGQAIGGGDFAGEILNL